VAALAAGGWGNLESRCVHSVGSDRVPVGGALELEVWPAWLLQEVLILSGGGARRSFTVECFRLRARGGPLGLTGALPLPELDAAVPDRISEAAVVGARRRGRRSWMEALRSSRIGDFPCAWGLLPFQGQSEEAAAARRRHVRLVVDDFVFAGGLVCIFDLCWDPFCNIFVSI
jgi:hypothetical protein